MATADTGGSGSTTSSERIRVLDAKLRAYLLREQGYSYRAIAIALAEQLGKPKPLSLHTIWKYINSELDRRRTLLVETTEVVRDLEVARLDRYLTKLEIKMADKGVGAGEIKGLVEAALKIQERRARLLGLDKPTKFEVTDTGRRPYENRSIAELDEELAKTEDALQAVEQRRGMHVVKGAKSA